MLLVIGPMPLAGATPWTLRMKVPFPSSMISFELALPSSTMFRPGPCSFSVVAALTGAETLSVDLSRKSLDRGRQNFALNGIDEAKHRFTADDALELLPRLEQRGERFDAIILDPPTFSRGNQGRLWQVEQHLEDLIKAALEVAMPKCAILLSTNCTKIDHIALERQARACAKVKRRTTDYTRTMALIDFPEGHGASTVWMMVR